MIYRRAMAFGGPALRLKSSACLGSPDGDVARNGHGFSVDLARLRRSGSGIEGF